MDRNKGKSLLDALSTYTVIDLETTGLDPSYDEIIELGAIKVVDGKIVDTYQQLVKPEYEIDDFIADLTGITNEMVKDAPAIKDVLSIFLSFIGNDVVIGHNVNFDINFIYDNLMNISNDQFKNDYLDTMRMARRILPEEEHHRLKDMKKYYSISSDTEHRSLADCIATHELYQKLLQDVEKKGIDLEAINRHIKQGWKASDILATCEPDENSPIFGKVVVFTGALERMVRKDAMQIVANVGGINGDNVTKKTNYLVLGNGDYSCILKDGKSTKHKKAEGLISKGADLQIISEDVFFDLIES